MRDYIFSRRLSGRSGDPYESLAPKSADRGSQSLKCSERVLYDEDSRFAGKMLSFILRDHGSKCTGLECSYDEFMTVEPLAFYSKE